MIDINVVDKAAQLKKNLDAAYLVFKKYPTIESSSKWTSALQEYQKYCVDIFDELVKEQLGLTDPTEKILKNFDTYHKCAQCERVLLYPTKTSVDGKVQAFVASLEFLENVPGWCYSCLTEHCSSQVCSRCTLVEDYTECPFIAVKNTIVPEVQLLTVDGKYLVDSNDLYLTTRA